MRLNDQDNTILNRLHVAILAIFCMMSTHLGAKADADMQFFYTSYYPMDAQCWTQDASQGNYHGDTLTSISEIAGSKWILYGFMAYDRMLIAGPSNLETKPYLRTVDKISAPISGIVFNPPAPAADAMDKIRYIRLTVSPNKDLSEGTVYEPKELLNSVLKEVVFEIGNPMPDMYYSIDMDLGAYKSGNSGGWFKIQYLGINSPESTEGIPDFSNSDKSGTGEYTVRLSAPEGRELHVMWGRYNGAGDPLENCFDELSANGTDLPGSTKEADVITDLSPDWTNPVDPTYTKTFRPGLSDYYILRAKTRDIRNRRHQSNEIVKIIRDSGIETGIESVTVVEGVGEERWFNMQGVQVSEPQAPGVYIHVRDGKARKIVL